MIYYRLNLIAVKTKQLAEDFNENKLWPIELEDGLQLVQRQLDLVKREMMEKGKSKS